MSTTTEPTPNLPLLRKVYEWVELEATKPVAESSWNQRSWCSVSGQRWDNANDEIVSCGTTYCFAGYTALVQGATFLRGAKNDPELDYIEVNGETLDVEFWAKQELGLTVQEADRLFYDTNDVDDIRVVLGDVARRAGEEW